MIMQLLLLVYVVGFLVALGFAVAAEVDSYNEDYVMAAIIALSWPFIIAIFVTHTLAYD